MADSISYLIPTQFQESIFSPITCPKIPALLTGLKPGFYIPCDYWVCLRQGPQIQDRKSVSCSSIRLESTVYDKRVIKYEEKTQNLWTVRRFLFLIDLLGSIKVLFLLDCCQKEVISDLKRENQFLSKETLKSIWLISRERSLNRF